MRIFQELGWYFKKEKRNYSIGIVLLLFVAGLDIYPPFVVRTVVDGMEQGTLTFSYLWKSLILLFLAGLSLYGLRYIWRILLFGSAFRLGKLLREELFAHFTRLSPRFYQGRRTGDLMAHATNDVQAVQSTAGEGVLTFIDSVVLGSFVIASMAIFISWKLTLIALLPMPLMAWAVGRYGKMMHQRFRVAQAAFSDINDKVQENISGVRVVKAFGKEETEITAFKQLSKEVIQKNMAVARVEALFNPTISLVVGLSFFLAIAFGSGFVVRGEITIGQLTQFTIYLGLLVWPMLAFGFLFNILQRGRASYDRIRALLAVKVEIEETAGALSQRASGDLTLSIPHFTYPGGTERVLKEIEIHIEKGATLGIVGRTGSGKTTLFKLLLRQFDVKEGSIQVGGQSIAAFTFHALRKAIGYVPQDSFLFSATIRENIAFGDPDATRASIVRAAQLAMIHEDILQFEKGYDTVVGERGVTLSGGQKQRISIARALLINPEILLLDDALSAVDAKTEQGILEALRNERAGKTTLIAAHRLSGIEHAEEIVVLDEGAIIERGTHHHLISAGGWYAWMHRQQQLVSLIEEGGGSDDHASFTKVSHSSS